MHIETPVVKLKRHPREKNLPDIFAKLECLQPADSFKIRGISLLASHLKNEQGVHGLVSSSGGNAGLATAFAADQLGLACTVVVPQSTSEEMIARIKRFNAKVIVAGKDWQEANNQAKQIEKEENFGFIHPFDHPLIWQGHSTIIDELVESNFKPKQIIASVGGGGLLSGILLGLEKHNWTDVTVVAVETEGAASLAGALEAGEQGPQFCLKEITSIAVTLGARQVAPKALELAQKHQVTPIVVSDRQAVEAIVRFSHDAAVLVEPSCGAALSVAYSNHQQVLDSTGPNLVIACGGAGVSETLIKKWSSLWKKPN